MKQFYANIQILKIPCANGGISWLYSEGKNNLFAWTLKTEYQYISISDTFHYVSCGASILRKRIVISNRNRTKPTALSQNIIMRSYPAKKRYAILGGSWQLPYGRWQHNGTMILLSSHRHKQWGQLCENHTGVRIPWHRQRWSDIFRAVAGAEDKYNRRIYRQLSGFIPLIISTAGYLCRLYLHTGENYG